MTRTPEMQDVRATIREIVRSRHRKADLISDSLTKEQAATLKKGIERSAVRVAMMDWRYAITTPKTVQWVTGAISTPSLFVLMYEITNLLPWREVSDLGEFSMERYLLTGWWVFCFIALPVAKRATSILLAPVATASVHWSRQKVLYGFILLIIWLLIIPPTLIGAFLSAEHVIRDGLDGVARFHALIASFFFTVLVLRPAVIHCLKIASVPSRYRKHPYDDLVLQVFDTASQFKLRQSHWSDARHSRWLISELERSAKLCENLAWRGRRVPIFDSRGRAEHREDMTRVAEALRSHKRLTARANGKESYQRISDSLVSGLIALIHNDWDALLETTPDPSVVTRARAWARRVYPAFILLVAGVAIPLIPLLGVSEHAGDDVRVTLMTAGILALALPLDSPASAKIIDALGKARS